LRGSTPLRVGAKVLACALSFWLLTPPGAAWASERSEVLFNEGLAAFLEGNYARAAERFREAAGADPKDATARLWLGMAEGREGSDRDAEAAFDEALAIDPNYADALLGRGIIRARRGERDAARNDWERAAEIGAGTPVKSEALRRLTGPTLGVPEERSWDLAAGLGAEYDTNVVLFPNQGDSPLLPPPGNPRLFFQRMKKPPPDHMRDARMVYYVEGGYRLKAGDRWDLGTRHSFYAATQFRSEDVNVVDYAPSVYANFKADPWLVGLQYTYRLFGLGGTTFLQSHEVEPSVTLREGTAGFSRLFYRYGRFSYRGAVNEADRRTDQDGDHHTVGLDQYVMLFDKRGYARLGAEFSRNLTQGTEFDASALKLSGDLLAPLPADFFLRISGENTWGHYDNESTFSRPGQLLFVTGPFFNRVSVPIRVGEKRRETLTSAAATLTRSFGGHWTGAARYTTFVNQATVDAYDWNRNIFSLFVTYNF